MGLLLAATTLTGCGGGSKSATTTPPADNGGATSGGAVHAVNPKPALEWVQIGYAGNKWLRKVKSAKLDGDTLTVATGLTAAETDAAKSVCTAFHAYEIYAGKGKDVKVTSTSGDALASC